MLGFPVHRELPELTQTHVHRVGDATQPSNLLSSPSLPASIFPGIRVFSNELALRIRWPKYWNFSFSISPSNEYSGFISFRNDWIDWFDQLVSNRLSRTFSSTTIWKHQFFSAQPSLLSNSHITTEKTMALTIGPLSAKRCLLFNTLSRFVITFLPGASFF